MKARTLAPSAGHRAMRAATAPSRGHAPADIGLGLATNWPQFTLLVVVNAFVGAMVGVERAVLPLLAKSDFGIASTLVVVSFVAAFGFAKAFSNLLAGHLVDARGRRPVLIAGWIIALPVPLMILSATSWGWIVAANALLGVNQGLAWSATVIMKIDLVGPRRRGLAMGLNEFAGYLAVAGAAFAAGSVASTPAGLRAGPAYLGTGIALTGLLLSVFFVRETSRHVALENSGALDPQGDRPDTLRLLRRSLWSDRRLFSVSQAGLVNNLNDGLAWGVFPLLFAGATLSVRDLSALVAIYPAVWGVCQLWTGPLSDRWGRKWLVVAGMLVQGIALIAIASTQRIGLWATSLAVLGVGTALVYPTLLAAVGDIARPAWRGLAVGVYRLWRDLGYVIGALVAGVAADTFGVAAAVAIVGAITIASGVLMAVRFDDTRTAGGM